MRIDVDPSGAPARAVEPGARARGAAPVAPSAARLAPAPRRPAGRRLRAAAAVLAVLSLGAACSSNEREETVLQSRIEVIEAEIRTRIGAALCTADSDCRALPIGALACGGPSRFLPYSIQNTDEGPLGRLSEDHRRLSAELVALRGTVGPCVVLQTPTADCERSQLSCRLR